MTTPFEIVYQFDDRTCGPASLLMACVALGLDHDDLYDTWTQRSLWRDTVADERRFDYTTHPQLAMAARRRGMTPVMHHVHPEGFRYPAPGAAGGLMPEPMFDDRMALYSGFIADCEAAGVEHVVAPITSASVRQSVGADGSVAILLTRLPGSTMLFHHRLVHAYSASRDVFHVACPIEGHLQWSPSRLETEMDLPYGRAMLQLTRSTSVAGS